MKILFFLAPVVGNFTEEDVNGISPQDSNSLEYPLQRDEVQSTKNNLGDKNFPMLSPKPVDPEETSVVGLIIAILTSIILVLVFAIMFIVARQRRTRTAAVLDALQHNLNSDGLSLGLDKRYTSNFKVRLSFHFFSIFFNNTDHKRSHFR